MEAPLLKIVERLAEVCDLGETERSWLVDKVTAEALRSGRHATVQRSDPSLQELDALDRVVLRLLRTRAPRGERAALRAKVARGCLAGLEQADLPLTDEILVAAAGALHAMGRLEPDDSHHLATFLGQIRAGGGVSDVQPLTAACQGLAKLPALSQVQRLDLLLSMLACPEIPFPVRVRLLEAAATGELLPADVGFEILERVLRGTSLYSAYWFATAGDYIDARPTWWIAQDDPERPEMLDTLARLAMELTGEQRDRAQNELDELDEMLDFLEADEGAELFEQLALLVGERLPVAMREGPEPPEMAPCGHDHRDVLPGLYVFESNVQRACDEFGAPRKAPDVMLVGLSDLVEELRARGVDPAAFAASIAAGDGAATSTLFDACGHVLEVALPEYLEQMGLPLDQIAGMDDDTLARVRELCLAIRDGIKSGRDITMPADLVELLTPFETRTAARLHRYGDEELSFAAARLLVVHGLPEADVARMAAAVWSPGSLDLAGSELPWVGQFVARNSGCFAPEMVAAVRLGTTQTFEGPEKIN